MSTDVETLSRGTGSDDAGATGESRPIRAGDDPPPGGVGWLALGLAVAAIGTAAVTVLFFVERHDSLGTSVSDLAGLLIGGLLTFLFGTAATVATFRALGLSEQGQPLGLPAGTVQAFIALFLILLFFIMSTFLYLNVSQTSRDPILRNLTQEQVEDIPSTEIDAVISTPIEVQGDDGASEVEDRFTVVLALPARSQIAEEIARQLVTTIGTLIVAIAAFYFGAKSVSAGRGTE